VSGWQVNKISLWCVLEDIPLDAADVLNLIALLGADITNLGTVNDVVGTLLDTGGVRLDVSKFQAAFAVNAIPTASVTINIGRGGADMSPSAVHFVQNYLRTRIKISVYAQVAQQERFSTDPNQPALLAWTNTPFRVFDGYTAGCGYRRTSANAEFVLHLVHWLDDLARSSPISGLTHPQNPAALAFPAMSAMGVGGPIGSSYTGTAITTYLATGANVEADFWGKVLRPQLLALAGQDVMHLSTAGKAVLNRFGITIGADLANRDAQRALNRFEPFAPTIVNPSGYVFGVPLAMDVNGITFGAKLIASQISQDMNATTLSSIFGKTTWDVILEHAAKYAFAVIPRIETALVVPLVKGLRATNDAGDQRGGGVSIYRSEIDYLQYTRATPMLLRGVIIYAGTNFQAGAPVYVTGTGLVGNPIDYQFQGVGGLFQGDSAGQFLWVQAPGWMSGVPWPLAGSLTLRTGASTLNPGVGAAPVFDPAIAVQDNGRIMDRFARAVYANETLHHRQADISGRLRFDICPGTSISIEGAPEPFVGTADQLGMRLYATVLQTTVVIDAETPGAATGFHISHWRTELENHEDRSSIDRHPIWRRQWFGSKLIDPT
jgi:hypothetical protein